jgi:UDP-glucose 4-epimerase
MGDRRTVLVVGGLGFIGSNVVGKLCADGHRVRVLDLRRHASLPLLEEVEFFEGDFSNKAVARQSLVGVSAVIHLATVTTPQSGTSDPVHDVTHNLVGTLELLAACREAGLRRFIFASSGGTVYGPPKTTPISEEHPERPVNSYGVVKLAIEKYLEMYSHLGQLDPVILRPSNPYGPGQYPWGSQGIVAVALGAIRDRRPFQLWGDGSVVRDYLFIEDLARAFVAALDVPPGQRNVFNIGSGRGRSVRDILDACQEVSGSKLIVERLPGRPIDAAANILDCSLARQTLGWEPTVRFDDGLIPTWHWIKSLTRPQ